MTLTKRQAPASPAPRHPAWWTVSTTWDWHGKQLTKGWTVRIRDQRGTLGFIEHVIAPPRPGSGKRLTKEWVTLMGPTGYRSVTPDKITAAYPPIKTRKRS
jgi:hypothetical protein